MAKDFMKVKDLKEWEDNPRNIKPEGLTRLKKQIKRLGQYKPLLVTKDGTVLGGNMRLKVYRELGMDDVWVSVVDAPDEKTKMAYALSDNDRAGFYLEDELLALIRETDIELDEFSIDLGDMVSLEDFINMNSVELSGEYTRKIEAPVYEPSDVKPTENELVDKTQVNKLLQEIDKSDLPKHVKEFLTISAYRMYVYDYALIADYYAHSDGEIKKLMEKLALVIIDYDKAVENGFVKLSKKLLILQGEDHEE